MTTVIRGLLVFIIFTAGFAASYFAFVPERDEAIARLVEHHKQKDADAVAQFNRKEIENAQNADQIRSWYRKLIANLKHDGLQVPQPGDVNSAGAKDQGAEGADVAIAEPGLAAFTKGRPILARIENCKEDAAKLTAIQLLLFKANVIVE